LESVAIIIVALIALITPSVLAVVNGRTARKSKFEDWARQDEVAVQAQRNHEAAIRRTDEVAAQAAVAAELLVQQGMALARSTAEVARVAASNEATTQRQLKEIHTFLNSDATAAFELALVHAKSTLVLLNRVIDRYELDGRVINNVDLEAIHATEKRISDLEYTLKERKEQQEAMNKEIELDLLKKKNEEEKT